MGEVDIDVMERNENFQNDGLSIEYHLYTLRRIKRKMKRSCLPLLLTNQNAAAVCCNSSQIVCPKHKEEMSVKITCIQNRTDEAGSETSFLHCK